MPFWESPDLDSTSPPAPSTETHPVIFGWKWGRGRRSCNSASRWFFPNCGGQILVFAFLSFHDSTEGVQRLLSGMGLANFSLGPGLK